MTLFLYTAAFKLMHKSINGKNCLSIFSHIPTFLLFTHFLTCTQTYPDFVAHLEKLAEAIHPLLDAPPVDIPGITAGSLRKRLAAAKTLKPVVKCGASVVSCFDHKLSMSMF